MLWGATFSSRLLARMHRIEGPAAADDSSRLLHVVARPRDELQAIDDGRRRQSLPQCRFVFVEVSQYRREKIRVVEVRHVTSDTAVRCSGKSWILDSYILLF